MVRGYRLSFVGRSCKVTFSLWIPQPPRVEHEEPISDLMFSHHCQPTYCSNAELYTRVITAQLDQTSISRGFHFGNQVTRRNAYPAASRPRRDANLVANAVACGNVADRPAHSSLPATGADNH